MEKKNIVSLVIILVFVVVSFYLVYAAGSKNWPFKTNYQVVVLQTGEVYFGNLSLFPRPKMTEVWLPQQSQDEESPGLEILPLESMYFNPENVLYFEASNIAWWSDLKEESEVVGIMTGKAQTQAQPTQEEITSEPETE